MAVKRKPTIYQVAEAAGVSIATVSRVFNGSDAVLPDVQRKVKAAAARMHYVPSASARNLSTQRTESIGLILPVLYGEFFSEILYGIDVGMRNSSFTLMLSSTHDHREEFDASFRNMQGRVDALIVMVLNDSLLDSIAAMNVRVPMVLIGAERSEITGSSVAVDNTAGAAAVANHLIGQGFKRLAVVTGSPDNIESAQRLEGFLSGCEEHGVARGTVTILPGTFSQRSGYDAGTGFLSLKQRPEAVFCSN
ncbi:MAG: LacI family DNA-binding transcriptional regulator, partial [Bacteroidetes bacterium]|nr:LacI family DNA-binding transcriptional regulator [Bacteroidota bacterium]